MSYPGNQGSEDPLASYGNAPSYSFGDQSAPSYSQAEASDALFPGQAPVEQTPSWHSPSTPFYDPPVPPAYALPPSSTPAPEVFSPLPGYAQPPSFEPSVPNEMNVSQQSFKSKIQKWTVST